MSFNYEKHKNHNGNDSFWTSYSDLFLGLSAIFLLLYVTASLRTSTYAIKAQMENRKLTMRVQDLENQLKMYDQVRKDYMENSATPAEAKEYRELLDKLTLLKEVAKDEKEHLQQQAADNAAKEEALNKYQQMIRNVINANKMAKTKIANREDVIDEQTDEMAAKNVQVADLQKETSSKQAQLDKDAREIKTTQTALKRQEEDLKKARTANKISDRIYQKRMAKLRDDGQEKIDQMRDAHERGMADLRGQLAKAQSEIGERRAVAQRIKGEFAAKGIKADIDMENGDVILDFGDHYFETGSADLKVEMKNILSKAIPSYSRSLFGDPKIAQKISAVEVIGFASPTYHGKFVDPNSSKPEDRQALKYNMDLSYGRAKSIFNYVLDDKSIKFQHQRELLPLLKVSGRSFLEVFKETRTMASGQDFCKTHDCKKAQRVIIRFSMDHKKQGSP
jgi:myosin heavy subunit